MRCEPMPDSINEIECTIFDTETTGLDPASGDRMVEIAAVRVKGRERLAEFKSFIRPGREISQAAFAVNHISQEMLEGAPAREEVLPRFLEFIRGSVLFSYNAGFDFEFLNFELGLINKEFPQEIKVLDILKMSRRTLTGLERYALWFVAQSLGIAAPQKHRAMEDVELTLMVFCKLKERLAAKGITSVTHFAQLFSVNASFLSDLNAQKLAQIQEAMQSGARLKLQYLSSAGIELTEREVIPREIKQENNQSYLIGFCCLRNDERTFRVDGILHLELI
jgi:DNA polymerase III subunit alpha, Gram-positive type